MVNDAFDQRFGGLARLYSRAGLDRLRNAHVCVVGLGGVGSWSVEALARSGVGRLTLVDLDDICVTNTNRQLHALTTTYGLTKARAMATRVRDIHPGVEVREVEAFLTAGNAESILTRGFDCVLDAIDSVTNKSLLIARCLKLGLPVVSTGAAGGRRDPTAVRVADLGRVTHDNLLRQVRKLLRKDAELKLPSSQRFGVPCVYSPEPVVYPTADGTVCADRDHANGESLRLGCDTGYGSATFVTGTFGFVAAAEVVRVITGPTNQTTG